jgi:triacylglycerol esterase/lipase EstA (alpha/beta hydrolase family)
MKTAEQASLLSIYIVGFQLPLSGAVLALPDNLEKFTQPFISAYWSWSGSITSMQDSNRQVIGSVIDTEFNNNTLDMAGAGISLPYWVIVLIAHSIIGIVLAYIGMRKHRWEH